MLSEDELIELLNLPFIGKRKIISQDECVKLFPKMSVQIYGENKMSRMINIKGKEISEDTIVEVLKKHCGAAFFEPLKAGDIVNDPHGEIQIIVENGKGGLRAFDSCGKEQHSDAGHFINRLWDGYYTRIGTLTDFIR